VAGPGANDFPAWSKLLGVPAGSRVLVVASPEQVMGAWYNLMWNSSDRVLPGTKPVLVIDILDVQPPASVCAAGCTDWVG
jgi:hypothetical protein